MSAIDSGISRFAVSGRKKNGTTAETVRAPMTRLGSPLSTIDNRSTMNGARAAPIFEAASRNPYVAFRTDVGNTSLVRSPTPKKLMLKKGQKNQRKRIKLVLDKKSPDRRSRVVLEVHQAT